MQHLSNFLLLWVIILTIIIISKAAKLLTDYLLTKIK
jgi:hypothetical protein